MINRNLIFPTINDQLPGTWRAEMLDYDVGPCAYSNGYMKAPSKIFPVKLVPTIGLRQIVLKFDFMGDSPFETAMAIADMTDELQKGAEILLPDGFLYWCEFDSASTPARKAPWIEQVKFTLHGVRHSRMEEITLTENGKIVADGETESLTKLGSETRKIRLVAEGREQNLYSVLKSVDRVTEVRKMGEAEKGCYEFIIESTADVRRAVSKAVARADGIILLMQPEGRSLEETFLNIISGKEEV